MKQWMSLAAATALLAALSGCVSDGEDGVAGSAGTNGVDGSDLTLQVGTLATKVQFEQIDTPLGDTQKSIQTSTKVTFGDTTQEIGFTKLLATGMSNNGEVFGQVKDYMDQAITFDDGSPYICNGTNDGVGSGLDYSSILQKNNKLYLVSQFECQVGAMYKAELAQDTTTGALSVKDNTLEFISQKDGFGGFVHCAGQRTPWESHLGSEEYETNARFVEEDANATTGLTGSKYYDETAKFWQGDATKMSPYYYGWTPEITIDANGSAVYTKHYAMGRMSHELSYVMPDRKTVYLSDDGTNVGLFMFVADKAEDLSAGTLYAAKWNQNSDADGGRADLSWVKLGHATNAEIKAILDADNNIATNDAPLFSDIFTTEEPQNGACATLTSVNTSAGHECLEVKAGQEKLAAFLEPRRYAAYLGATTEFRKEEGITFSADHNKLFVAMSEVAKGMEDDSSSDVGGNNDIRLAKNSCGAVYALDVASTTQKDSVGGDIESAYVVNNMYSIINGIPKTYDATSEYAGNKCDVNGISNPDNVTYLKGSNLLFIGEDTSSHINNMIWAYDIENGSLVRTFTTPLGAETTSPFWYENINGYGYMTAVTQHPDADTAEVGESSIGVMGPIKNLDTLNGNSLVKLGAYNSGVEGGSEISAYDTTTKKLFITNGGENKLDVVSLADVQNPTLLTSISLASYGAGVQSVAVANGKVAVAVGSADKTAEKGKVVIFNTDGSYDKNVTVGYLPDMVTFNEDGTKIIVANEGEPDASTGVYVDVNGTVGIVDVATGSYNEVGFVDGDLNDAQDGTVVRLGGTPSNSTSLDLEPEYISVVGNKAYVTLQENNAVARIDISGAVPTVDAVQSLGAKDYASENKIDIEEDGKIIFKNHAGLKALYQPDSITSYTFGGATYLVTANEGDGREYLDSSDNDVFVDEIKLKNLGDIGVTPPASLTGYKDLKVMADISTNTTIYTYGGRSFAIWDEDGELVWDSGDEISRLVAQYEPKLFNQDEGVMDGRSGNKGAEPEALTVGMIDGKTYAFIGLERQSAILMYDISNPYSPTFVEYLVTHDKNDVSPEGMVFIPASKSPNGKNLLVVSYEVSGSTAIYEIK
ncbi:MAG: choice-of-anchor I family protein [Campylobacterales bacterium]|nr:choice-of-anchor I family protein [Campylobacterales bacterium]